MILQALIAYAEREKLGDADFETVGVRWVIPLNRNGQLAGDPIPLAENPNEKKPRPKAMSRPFTSPNELNQGTKSHFLCDTLERATLFLDPKTPDKAEGRCTQHGTSKRSWRRPLGPGRMKPPASMPWSRSCETLPQPGDFTPR